MAYRHIEHHIWRHGVYSPTCWPSPSFSIIHHLRISTTSIIKTHQTFPPPTDKMNHNTNDLKEFKRNLLPSLVDFVDNIMTEKDWKKVITHDKSVQKINYHLDRQGVSVLPPWVSSPLGCPLPLGYFLLLTHVLTDRAEEPNTLVLRHPSSGRRDGSQVERPDSLKGRARRPLQ